MSVYRGKSSIWEYLTAGAVTGGLFRVNLGLRGLVAGAAVGTALGLIAGSASLGIMKLSGTSMEEVRYWQYQWHKKQIQLQNEGYAKQAEEEKNPLLDAHHDRVGKLILSLDAVTSEENEDSKPQSQTVEATKSSDNK